MDNLTSKRMDFNSFVYDTDFEESPYFRFLQQPLDKKAVLILDRAGKREENAKKAARFLAKKRFTVYVSPALKASFGDNKRIIAVEEGSDEYYRALACAKHIIAQTILPREYINRDAQVVINDVIHIGKAVSARINRNLNNRKSDYFIKNEYRDSGMEFDRMLKRLARGKLHTKDKPKTKREILFVVNLKNDERLFDLFERMAAQFDRDTCNVSLLIDNAVFVQFSKRLEELGDSICVYTKHGKFLRSLGDDKKIAFLNKEFGFIDNKSEIDSFLPKYIFDYEANRLTGKSSFDTVVSIGFDTFYWLWLSKSMAEEKLIIIDNTVMKKQSTELASGKANSVSVGDRVYFYSSESMKIALELVPSLEGKASALPYFPCSENAHRVPPEILTGDSGARLIVDIIGGDLFDSVRLKTVPYFDEKGANCFFVDNSIDPQDEILYIKAAAETTDKPLFVIDVYDHLINTNIKTVALTYGITYVTDPSNYASLLSRFDTCMLPAPNDAAAYEANRSGVKTVLVNSDGVTEELPKTNNYTICID